jgi:hypothetical protein
LIVDPKVELVAHPVDRPEGHDGAWKRRVRVPACPVAIDDCARDRTDLAAARQFEQLLQRLNDVAGLVERFEGVNICHALDHVRIIEPLQSRLALGSAALAAKALAEIRFVPRQDERSLALIGRIERVEPTSEKRRDNPMGPALNAQLTLP